MNTFNGKTVFKHLLQMYILYFCQLLSSANHLLAGKADFVSTTRKAQHPHSVCSWTLRTFSILFSASYKSALKMHILTYLASTHLKLSSLATGSGASKDHVHIVSVRYHEDGSKKLNACSL